MEQALQGVRVIDLTHHIAGPFGTKMLADYGAEVVKVEPPAGEVARRLGPFAGDEPHVEKSGLFLHLNTNKLGVTLNLKAAAGVAILKRLVAEADILVENFAPRVLPALGLDDATLRALNPRLVITHISNFGQTGPYRDWKASDLIIHGMGGALLSTGRAELEPVRLVDGMILCQGGNLAAAATLATFFGAEEQGVGESVDISLFETQAGTADMRATLLLAYEYHGVPAKREQPMIGILPTGYYPARDGFVYLLTMPLWWPRLARMLGRPEVLEDPHWTLPNGLFNPEAKEELDVLFYVWVADRTKRQAMVEAQAADIPLTALNDVADLLADAHFRSRGFWAAYDHPLLGRVTQTGAPLRFSEGGYAARRAAPLLGQHNHLIFGGRLGYSEEELARLRKLGVI
jgi:crotonobetainyl-CoA:carnitine CoA-transferase CaiB-like acyl-CoA transferase